MRISATKGKFGDLKFSMEMRRGYPSARIISVKSTYPDHNKYSYTLLKILQWYYLGLGSLTSQVSKRHYCFLLIQWTHDCRLLLDKKKN